MARMSKEQRKAAKRLTARYANALSAIANSLDELNNDSGYGPVGERSKAAREAQELSAKYESTFSRIGEMVSSTLVGKLGVATDHLRATERLIVAKKTGIFSIWSTARSAFESLGEIYWLTEPGIDSKPRLSRAINLGLTSMRGAQIFVKKGRVANEDIVMDPKEAEENLLQMSVEIGLDVIDGYTQPAGKPTFTSLVDDLTEGGVYSLSSAMAHGELWVINHHLRDRGAFEDPGGQNRSIGQLQVTVEEYRVLAVYVHAAFGRTVKRLCDYMGWDGSKYGRTSDRSAELLRSN